MGDGLDRGVRPVRRREGVVDIDVAELGKLLGEAHVVLFLARVVAKVLQHGHLARLQRIDAAPRLVANAILDEMHLRAAHQLGDLGRDRRKRGLWAPLALGTAEMGEHDHLGAAVHELLDGRQHARDARRVGHFAVLHRHVEIDADEHALAPDVEPIDGADTGKVRFAPAVHIGGAGNIRGSDVVHINLLITTAVSLMRLEKPHSLSYQATTRQNVPSTT